jgi:hypothetical protein
MREWIRDMGANRDVRAEMWRAGMYFNAGFAVFCAGFRRGERGCASGDGFLTRCLQGCASGDVFLTQGLQGSAQGFAGASGDVASGDGFYLKLLD